IPKRYTGISVDESPCVKWRPSLLLASRLHFSDERIVSWILHYSTGVRGSVSGGRLRPHEGLKYHGTTEGLHVRSMASHALNHAYESHVIGRIDPEPGA